MRAAVDLAGLLLDARLEHARPAHLDALGDAVAELAVGFRVERGQQRRERGVRAAGRGILRDAVERREHAGPHVEFVAAAVSQRT